MLRDKNKQTNINEIVEYNPFESAVMAQYRVFFKPPLIRKYTWAFVERKIAEEKIITKRKHRKTILTLCL